MYLTGALVMVTVSGLVLRADGARQAYLMVTAIEVTELAGASLLLATVLSVLTRSRQHDMRGRPGSQRGR